MSQCVNGDTLTLFPYTRAPIKTLKQLGFDTLTLFLAYVRVFSFHPNESYPYRGFLYQKKELG
jgi:hypothetical protein